MAMEPLSKFIQTSRPTPRDALSFAGHLQRFFQNQFLPSQLKHVSGTQKSKLVNTACVAILSSYGQLTSDCQR